MKRNLLSIRLTVPALIFCGMVVLLSASAVWGTAQLSDQLVYDGQTMSLYSTPLESYFDDAHQRPRQLFGASCTACWRGYIATWKIDHDILYLTKIVEGTCGRKGDLIPISKVIENAHSPVKATWFSGTLRIPQGKLLAYVHGGFESRYEKDLLIDIKQGRVVGQHVRDNRNQHLNDPPKQE